MNQQEQDAVLGRLHREKQEYTRNLAALTAKASRIGKEFERLGGALQHHPHLIVWDEKPKNFQVNIDPAILSTPETLMPKHKILSLVADIKTTRTNLEKAEREITAFEGHG